MNTSMRRFAISMLSGSLIALGSTLAIADGVNNVDNTSQGESGHGTGCSNFLGGCRASEVASAHGASQSTDDLGTTNAQPSATVAPSASTPAKEPYVGCLPASEGTPGHCLTGGINN